MRLVIHAPRHHAQMAEHPREESHAGSNERAQQGARSYYG
jgi:hypothetical protein